MDIGFENLAPNEAFEANQWAQAIHQTTQLCAQLCANTNGIMPSVTIVSSSQEHDVVNLSTPAVINISGSYLNSQCARERNALFV